MNRDAMSEFACAVAIPPTVQTNSDSPIIGAIVPLPMAEAHTIVIQTGNVTDPNVTVTVSVSAGNQSDGSDMAAVPASELVGTLAGAGFNFAADNAVRKIGYVGNKRYLRVTLTPSGNDAGSLPVAAVLISTGLRYGSFKQNG